MGSPWLVRILLAAIAFVAFALRAPPEPVPASAPLEEFSAERAMAHLEVIAAAPRPVGSDHHRAVRDLLVTTFGALELETSVQRDDSVSTDRVRGGVLHNVVAVLPGVD